MNKFTSILLASTLLTAAVNADTLKEKGGYVGIAYGVTSLEDDDYFSGGTIDSGSYLNSDLDDKGQAWEINGGYRFFRYFAIEARYTNFGEYTADLSGRVPYYDGEFFRSAEFTGEASLELSSFTLHAIGILPFGQSGFDIYGQLGGGILNYKETIKVSVPELGSDKVDNDDQGGILSIGFGARYTPPRFQHLTVQLAYDIYSFAVEDSELSDTYNQSISMGKLGLQYNF